MLRSAISRSEFFRNVLTMMSGTVMAQLIPVALSPVLSRLYSPDEFGVFSLFTSIASVVAVIATFRYELAIMLPEKEENAFHVLLISLIITVSLTLLVTLIVVVFHEQIPVWLKTPEIQPFLYFVPPFLLFAGISQALNYWSSRQKKFRLLATGKIGQSGAAGGVSIVLGTLNFSALGLVLGAVAGQLSSFLIMTAGSLKRIFQLAPMTRKNSLKENFSKYSTFMKINTPHALLGVVQDLIVIFLINHFFSKTVLGWYALSFRILKVPAGFIGAAVYQVYFQRISTIRNDTVKLQELTKKVYLQMFTIGLPVFTLIAILAPVSFSWIFGKEWLEAGKIAQILSPWLMLNFIISPVAAITVVLNRQQWAIWFTVVDTIMRSAAIVIGGLSDNSTLAFALLSFGSGSLLAYALYWFYRLPSRAGNVEYGK